MRANFIILFLVFFSILIIIFFRIKFELNHYKLKKIIIKTDKKKYFNFIYLSDLHEKNYNDKNKKLIDDIKNKNIETLIIGGDLITCSKNNSSLNCPSYNNSIKFLEDIKKNTNIKNIYYGLGNHELNFKNKHNELFNEYKSNLQKLGIIFIDNKLNIDNNITLYSIDIDTDLYKFCFTLNQKKFMLDNVKIKNLIGNIDKNKFNIVLCHNPDFSENLIDYGFDLVLSAHTHGGLIRLPIIGAIFSPELLFLPKYSKGLYNYKNKNIFVSSGLGEHSIKIRINNFPEIYDIEIGDL